MALPALVSLELPGGGLLEPLGRAPLRFHLRHARSPWLSVLGLGREDDVQHPSFHPRIVVDGGDVLHGLHHLLQHLPAELGVGHLAALEAHRHLRLLAVRLVVQTDSVEDTYGGRPPGHERPTVRSGARTAISRVRSPTTRSSGTVPTSSPVRGRRLTVPAARSRSPTTSM